MAKFTILAALGIGFGCSDKNGDSVGESDTDTDADTDTDTDADPTGGTVNWGTDSVTVTINGGSGSLHFGIVEQSGAKSWIAEDCIGITYAGYGNFCHTVAADSVSTIDCVATPDEVTDDTTLFCGVDPNTLTYYFATMDDSWCAVSGPDASYYSGMGCDSW
jgi:hypothetical protein